MKRLIAIALSALAIFALVGCSSGSSSSSTPKDYAQIIHDARSDEENEYQMIARPGEEEGQGHQARQGPPAGHQYPRSWRTRTTSISMLLGFSQ